MGMVRGMVRVRSRLLWNNTQTADLGLEMVVVQSPASISGLRGLKSGRRGGGMRRGRMLMMGL